MSGGSSSSSHSTPHDDGHHGDHDGLPTTPETNHGPDWLHNDDHGTSHDDHSSGDVPASTPDWLKETESPFGEEDVLSKEVASTTISNDHTSTADTPDWMHTEPKTIPSIPPVAETLTTVSAPETSHDIPDWLKGSETVNNSTDVAPSLSDTPAVMPVIPEVTPTVTPETTPHEDVPDWLK